MKPIILNIQKYSVHDGDGIRTTIFFKGCPLKCMWCHNPESQNYNAEFMFDREKCKGCGLCADACSNNAISYDEDHKAVTNLDKCTLCEKCFDYCIEDARQKAGNYYNVDELISICERDMMFYEESGGGVTLSGGEVMAQNIDYVEELLRKLKDKGINTAVDTCGYAKEENFKRVLKYTDTFLYDIKIIDNEKHKYYTGKSNELILKNIIFLADAGADINVRIPVIDGINSSDKDILDTIKFLKENVGFIRVNILPYHNTGSSKYERLGRKYNTEELNVPSKETMEHIQYLFNNNGFKNVKIGG